MNGNLLLSCDKLEAGCAMVASDEHLYVIGGRVDNKCLSSAEPIGNLRENRKKIRSIKCREYGLLQ